MKCKITLLPCVYLCLMGLFGNSLSAQVWALQKGETNLMLSYSSLQYDQAFNADGEIVELPVLVRDRTLKLTAQYGITDKLTVEARLPYMMQATEGDPHNYNSYPDQYLETGTLQALGNVEGGVIYQVYSGKPRITASLFVEAPSGQHNYLTGLQTGFNSWGFRPGVGVGYGFNSAWLQYYLGTSLRNNAYSHAAVSSLEFGYKPVDYLYAALALETRQSFGNGGDCDCTTSATALYQSEQEYISLTAKAGFMVDKIGVHLGYATAFYGSEVAAAGVPLIGIQFRSN